MADYKSKHTGAAIDEAIDRVLNNAPQDGFSPIVTIDTITDGHRVNIRDKNGTKSFDVMDGEAGQDGKTPVKGVDYFDGEDGQDGADGVSPTVTASKSGKVTTVTIKDVSGTKTATINDGEDGVGVVSIYQKTTSLDDGGENVLCVEMTDGTMTNFKVKNGRQGSQGEAGADGKTPVKGVDYFDGQDGAPGADGERGLSVLRITSGPSSYTTTVGGFTPAYRVALSTVKSQAKVDKVLVGDTIVYSYYTYSVGYVDANYVYIGSRVSIRGSTGAAGEAGADGKDGADYSFDPTVYGLPVLYLTGDVSPIRVSKDNTVTLTYVYGDRSGTCTLKGQGATSYKNAQALGEKGKYNYTIKFDNAFEAHENWGAQKKYCLKANYIDHSHARNVVSAKLWGMIVKSRTNANANLSGLVNGGAVDGFPIVIMVNGEFHGLYTFNIPKDGWMMGMVEDTTKQQALLGANDHEAATQFKGLLAGDESDFELEFVSDEDNAGWVTTSLNRMIQACIDSWGGDMDSVVGQYLDWDSVIDYYIWVVVCKGTDMVDKNYLLSTFDGTKWHFTAYDMDSTYGLEWDGSGLTRAVSNENFVECAEKHRAYELVKRFKTNALKARYNALRANVLSETRIMQMFENFAWAIPSPLLVEDVKRYPAIPGSSVNGIDQIGRWVRQRLEAADAWLAALPAQETPEEPEEPVEMVNQVPISTDTDGSIYNGTGYKDNVRLSSSGGVSGTAQNGSVTTGFIPCKNTDVIRIKGAEWLNATTNHQGHYYIIFYNQSKTIIGSAQISSGDYSSTWASKMSITYDSTTGVTMFDIVDGTDYHNDRNSAAYFRINAYGKGADLIVTVNQEIT